jgi:hypothetical protein
MPGLNKFRMLGYISGYLNVRSSLLNVGLYDKPEIKTENMRTTDR